jgi:hypothetical protein
MNHRLNNILNISFHGSVIEVDYSDLYGIKLYVNKKYICQSSGLVQLGSLNPIMTCIVELNGIERHVGIHVFTHKAIEIEVHIDYKKIFRKIV